MENDLIELLKKFHEICIKRWIKGVNNDVSGVGLTLEKELGKEIDSDVFPDFNGIELKCSQRYSGFPISLLNKSFDGPRLFETNYIVNKYGKEYYDNSDKKYLFVNFEYNKKVLVYEKYYFELLLSKTDKKMYFNVYDLENNLLDTSYIDLTDLETRISLKLTKLALIYASKNKMLNNNYFRYYDLKFYKLKSIDAFYELIQNNIIKVSIICRASYNKDKSGLQKNKGVNFKIDKKDIEKLFDLVLEYNHDENKIILNSEFIFQDMAILQIGDFFEKLKHME